jgi:dUTP pyrophosphatase
MKIKIVNISRHDVPEYKTISSAGMDVYANLEHPVSLKPFQRELIPTGLFIELPEGYEAQIRPRSGLCLKHGVTVLNSPGTIDADYRGEIGIIVINLSDKEYTIHDGERLCQMIIAKHERIEWNIVRELTETDRGKGGFGHTGIKK